MCTSVHYEEMGTDSKISVEHSVKDVTWKGAEEKNKVNFEVYGTVRLSQVIRFQKRSNEEGL